jgi:hypothetical protein
MSVLLTAYDQHCTTERALDLLFLGNIAFTRHPQKERHEQHEVQDWHSLTNSIKTHMRCRNATPSTTPSSASSKYFSDLEYPVNTWPVLKEESN